MDINAVREPGEIPEDRKAKLEDREYYRNESIKSDLHKILRVFIYVAFGTLICVFVVRMWHLVSPCQLQWLTSQQIQGIEKMFFSGAVGGVLGGYLKHKLIKNG